MPRCKNSHNACSSTYSRAQRINCRFLWRIVWLFSMVGLCSFPAFAEESPERLVSSSESSKQEMQPMKATQEIVGIAGQSSIESVQARPVDQSAALRKPATSTVPEARSPTAVPTQQSSASSLPATSTPAPASRAPLSMDPVHANPLFRQEPVTATVRREPTQVLPNDARTEPSKSATGETQREREEVSDTAQRVPQDNNRSNAVGQPKPESMKLQRSGSLIGQSVKKPNVVKSTKPVKELREIVVVSVDMKEAESVRKYLATQGVGIVNRRKLGNLGLVSSTFRYSEPHDEASLRKLIEAAFPESSIEANQRFYLLSQKQTIKKNHVLGHILAKVPLPSRCASKQHIAMLDATVAEGVLDKSSKRIKVYQVRKAAAEPSEHGTSVASLLISETNEFPGLLSGAYLSAINVFYPDEDGELETRTDWVLAGLDVLAGLSPKPVVVNMSFGGGYSQILAQVFDRLSKQMYFVAAAGNSGTEQAVFPAAYASVYGVGALNGNGARLKLSSHGEHVSVFAPGEDIWTRNAYGEGFYAQGSSYAAPFAAAAIAKLLEQGGRVDEYLASLGDTKKLSFEGLCI